jgi:hypothetical protein
VVRCGSRLGAWERERHKQMCCRVERLLVVAGPTGCGKSTLIQRIRSSRLPEIGMHLGIQGLETWPASSASSVARLTKSNLKGLILHWDFLWSDGWQSETVGDSYRALWDVLQRTRDTFLITIWTACVRLERQIIDGKLRRPAARNVFELCKSACFRCLPDSLIPRVARLPLWWPPQSAIGHHLATLKLASHPAYVVAVYQRWFRFCEEHIPRVRSHAVVELDQELNIYSCVHYRTLFETVGS